MGPYKKTKRGKVVAIENAKGKFVQTEQSGKSPPRQ